MAAIPTIKELYDSIRQNLETELNITIPVFGKVVLNAFAAVMAAKLKLYWLATAELKRNIWVDTASPEANGGTLERFGRVKIGRSPFAATQGKYDVSLIGIAGAEVPSGTIFKSDDESASPGYLFIVDVTKVFATDVDTVEVRALTAGTEARLVVADTLTATQPLLNIDDQGTVTAENVIPLEAETIEEYREAIIQSFQLEAQGGAATDYRIWANDAQGVRAVYPYTKSGSIGEIEVYVEATEADSLDGFGTPTAAILTDVSDVLELDPDDTKPLNERGRRPLGVYNIDVLAVTVLPVDITINNPTGIDAATETLIENTLDAAIKNIRPFVDGADIETNRNDTLDVNKIIAVIQGALTGTQRFDSISIDVDGNPIATTQLFTDGDIPYFNTATFV